MQMIYRSITTCVYWRKGPIWMAGALLMSVFLFACDRENLMETDTDVERPTPTVGPEIGWISMDPRMPLPTSVDAPAGAGWPVPGQEVRWQAHLFNRSGDILYEVRTAWHVDGHPAAEFLVRLPPGETVVELARPWSEEREAISFAVEIDSVAGVPASDRITVLSNALTVGFWLEQIIYDWMEVDPNVPPFEQWAREEVADWNATLENSTPNKGVAPFDDTPLDRLRLDRITVLPTGSDYPTDLDTDFVWYFNDQELDHRFLRAGSSSHVVADQTIVLRELMHQRGLVDLYAYEVMHATPNGSEVRIVDPDGAAAAGTERMPFLSVRSGGRILYTPNFDDFLMGRRMSRPTFLARHSIYGLNLFAGRRTPRLIDEIGNRVNRLMDGNPYTTHVPARIELELTAPGGGPLDDVAVDVFLDHGRDVDHDIYREDPDVTVQANSDGIAVLSAELWDDRSWRKRRLPSVIILRVRSAGDATWGYAFLPVYDLNMAYIGGQRDVARIAVPVGLQ